MMWVMELRVAVRKVLSQAHLRDPRAPASAPRVGRTPGGPGLGYLDPPPPASKQLCILVK